MDDEENNVMKRMETLLDDVIPEGTFVTGWGLVVSTMTPGDDGETDGIWITWNDGAPSYHPIGLFRSAQVHLENGLI